MSENYKVLLEQAIGNKFQKLLAPQQNQGGLLNFVKSPYAQDIGMGLLAQSGYSPMPTSLGQSLGVAMNQANQLRSQRRANEFAELGTLTKLSEFFKEPERKIIEDALGRKRYADSGGLVFPDLEMPEPERKTAEDSKGILRYTDDGTQVFKNDKVETKRETAEDSQGILRYTDTGEQVFKDDKPEIKRDTAEDIKGILRYTDTGEQVFSTDKASVAERKTQNDRNGVLRFLDTGEPVFPNVEDKFTPSTAKDANDRLRYTDGDQKGELVFPKVEVKDKFVKPSYVTFQSLKDPTEQISLNLNDQEDAKKAVELAKDGFVIRQENLSTGDIKRASQASGGKSSSITDNNDFWSQISDESVVTDVEYDDGIKIAQAGNKGIQAGDELRKLILEDPNIAGTMGSLQQLAKSTGGTLESLGLGMPFLDQFQKESISKLANLENQLAYSLATVRGYKSGNYEVKQKDIQNAKDELNITGMLGGAKGVLDRVNSAIEEIALSTNDAQRRIDIDVIDYSQFIYTGD
tara:strand:- start:2620 stop:4179 length:1560 start_codon:yes stop_codon:yes gene_type:complete